MSGAGPSRRAVLAGAVALALPACLDSEPSTESPAADATTRTPTAESPVATEDVPTATTTEGMVVAPTARFAFEYDASAGVLTVTHAGGGTIVASELRLRGEGFGQADGADMTAPGRWAGEASGTLEGEPAVRAGDAVTVGVTPAYVVRVVWAEPDSDRSAMLAADRGPDA